MNRAFQLVACICMLAFSSVAQRVGSVDLTHPQEAPKPAEVHERRALPNGCEELLGGGIADGWVEPEDHQPREIVVKVINVSDLKPVLGSELQADVELQNQDKRPIQIPWSTDSALIDQGQDPRSLHWDVGTFEFKLSVPQDIQVRLRSLTGWLYGSEFSAGSRLTIQPGETIMALVKFKLEDEYAIQPERLKEGEWQLSAEWHQVRRSWHLKGCEPWNGYFQFDKFYRQRNLPMTIQVTTPDTGH